MSRLEQARKRLDVAIERLESAIGAQAAATAANGGDAELAVALEKARADYAALKDVTATVRARLDGTIERLENVIEP